MTSTKLQIYLGPLVAYSDILTLPLAWFTLLLKCTPPHQTWTYFMNGLGVIRLTKRQNELYSEVRKLFSQNSTGLPALLPCALLQRQAGGTHRKQATKPSVQFILSHSIM